MSVAFDADTNGGGLTFTHTVGSGSDRYLVVGVVGTNAATFEVAGITAGGVAMARLHRNTDPAVVLFADLWGLVNPASGDNSIVITMDGSGATAQGAISFSGVDQDVPFGGAGSDGAISQDALGPRLAGVSGAMMAGIIGANSNVTAVNGTQAWNDGGGDAMGYVVADQTSQALEWTLDASQRWVQAAVMLRPTGAPHDNEYGNRRTR